MIKNIKYNGYTAVPSDYECQDGDLGGMMDIVPDNGSLRPVLPATTVLNLYTSDLNVIYVHQTTAYTHYIIYQTSTSYMWWLDSETELTVTDSDSALSEITEQLADNLLGTFTDLSHVNAVGNTLLVFTSSATNYYLYTSGAYKSLGDHIPNIEINFGLRGRPRLWSLMPESSSSSDERGTFTISFDSIDEDDIESEWSDDNKTTITSQIMAKVNKFLAENTTECGRFVMPFLVRYALRLYDDSLVGHSAPILMNPSTSAAPVVMWKRISGKGSYSSAELDIMLVAAKLDYRIVQDIEGDYLKLTTDWTDIVKSVDVFISKPIYTYDQSGECESFLDNDNLNTKFIGTLDFTRYNKNPHNDRILLPMTVDGTEKTKDQLDDCRTDTLGKTYTEYKYSTIYQMCFSTDRSYPANTVALPEYAADEIEDTIKGTSNFYLLHSIELDELISTTRTDIDVDDEYLQSLVNREAMTDDYLSHDRLIATESTVYNSRLNLSGVTRELFSGFTPESQFANCTVETIAVTIGDADSDVNGNYLLTVDTCPSLTCYQNALEVTIAVYIKENDEIYKVTRQGRYYSGAMSAFSSSTKTTTVDGESVTSLNGRSWPTYFFYPNTNAYKMIITDSFGQYEITLKEHDYLSGAIGLLDYEQEREQYQTVTAPTVTHSEDDLVEVPSKLYTSDVNNPFRFDVTNITTIGTGRILGVATAAKALSEGQFGQFPLYAFTTEGVWAMEVSTTTGAFSAVQPITRDVIVMGSDGEYNKGSITQIDSAVLYATDRGIMHLSGSNSMCISDILNGDDLFTPLSLPNAETIITAAGFTTDQLDFITFKDFIRDCAILYDYTHQRIILFNPGCLYAYVYSMKDKKWGVMASLLSSKVNSYPEALAMTSEGKLVNLCVDSDDAATGISGLVFTRPFFIDDPDIFKTVDCIIQRGYFQKDHVSQVLFGSNDLFNWHTVWSSVDRYLRGFRGSPYKVYRLALICSLDKEESISGFSVQYEDRLTNQPR